MICLVCLRNDAHRYSCDDCTNTTRRRLREIELYAQWLATPAMLEPTRGTTGRRSPGYSSRPPARDDVLVMLDHRSRTEPTGPDDEDTPAWSILGTLYAVATYVRGHAHDHAPRRLTLASELGYLLGRLDWCATQPWADVVLADVRQLHAQARAAAGDRPPNSLGTCTEPDCGGAVYPARLRDPDGSRYDGARCKRCGHPYTGLDLVRLRTEGMTA
jgi:hypothetical protein